MLRDRLRDLRAFIVIIPVAVVFTAAVMALFVVIIRQTTQYDIERIGHLMVGEADRLSAVPPSSLPEMLARRRLNGPDQLTLVSLFGPGGKSIWGSLDVIPRGLVPGDVPHKISELSPSDPDTPFLALTRQLPGGYTLVVYRGISTTAELRQAVLRVLLVGFLPLLAAGLLVGGWFVLRTTRRLRGLRAAITRIMQGNLSERLPMAHHSDDLDQLVQEVNFMLDTIQRLAAEMQSVGDDIARDLCTPLTRIRARLDHGRSTVVTDKGTQELIDASIADLDATFAIMTTLLRLGEIQSGRGRNGFTQVDLAEIAQEVAEMYAPMAETANLTLDVQTPMAAPMEGDRDLLVEAVANLVSNAIKFTPPPGRISLTVETMPGGIAVSVADTGPGLPAAVDKRLRLGSRKGLERSPASGGQFGLCLVLAIARLHDLRLAVEYRHGCVFRLLTNDIQTT
jgi:signal transduction histidine kinase